MALSIQYLPVLQASRLHPDRLFPPAALCLLLLRSRHSRLASPGFLYLPVDQYSPEALGFLYLPFDQYDP